jgi:LPXTG-site transpeptidase (sortase) family protein
MKTNLFFDRYQGPSKAIRRRVTPVVLILFIIIALLGSTIPSTAADPDLEIIPITWNVIGLDADDVNRGPNTYYVGARICNNGDAAATNLVVGFFWDPSTSSPYINLANPENNEYFLTSLANDSCTDVYFPIVVTRDTNAYDSSASYYLAVTAENTPAPVYSPDNREIYVERLTATPNLSITSITGSTRLVVGNTYDFIVTSSTVTGDTTNPYQQLVHYLNLPEQIFRLVDVATTYTLPALATNDKLYADACGWENDITSPDYRSCVGPANYITGTVGGTVVTTYTVEVLATGTANLVPALYGFADDQYEYHQDYGADTLNITAVEASVISIPIVQNPATPTVLEATPTLTASATATGTIIANPAMSKSGNRTQLSFGDTLTFTITIRNNGSAPALKVRLSDSLEAYSYLRVTNPTTTQGTARVEGNAGRTVIADIGTLNPNEVVTVTFQISVITTPATTQSLFNTATITFEWPEGTTSQTRSATSSVFTVRGGSTLPGTGELPLETSPNLSVSQFLPAIILGGVVVLAIMLLMVKRKRSSKSWYWRIGVLLSGTAMLAVYLSACQPDQAGADLEVNVNGGELSQAPGLSTAPTETINPLITLPAYLFGTPEAEDTLPSYPIPTPTLSPEIEEGNTPDTSPIVRIVIPSLDLDAKVAYVPFDGQTWMIQGLREEIAWMGNTSWPGLGGNTGLAGHVTVRGLGNGPFRYLDDIIQNDVIYIYTEENIYTYSVREKRVVDQADLSVVDPSENAQITLITCLEWDEDLEIYIKRLAVMADLVRTDKLFVSSNN